MWPQYPSVWSHTQLSSCLVVTFYQLFASVWLTSYSGTPAYVINFQTFVMENLLTLQCAQVNSASYPQPDGK